LRLNKIPLTKLIYSKFFQKTWDRIGYIIFTLLPYTGKPQRGEINKARGSAPGLGLGMTKVQVAESN